jgi:hypothetical protein
LERERDGLRRIDFLRLSVVSKRRLPNCGSTNSAADTGRGTSNMGVGNWGGVGSSSHGESISSWVLGVTSGDGDGNGTERSFRKLKGAL